VADQISGIARISFGKQVGAMKFDGSSAEDKLSGPGVPTQ